MTSERDDIRAAALKHIFEFLNCIGVPDGFSPTNNLPSWGDMDVLDLVCEVLKRDRAERECPKCAEYEKAIFAAKEEIKEPGEGRPSGTIKARLIDCGRDKPIPIKEEPGDE